MCEEGVEYRTFSGQGSAEDGTEKLSVLTGRWLRGWAGARVCAGRAGRAKGGRKHLLPGSMAGEHRHVMVQQPVAVHRSRSRALGASSSSRRRENLEGGRGNSNGSSYQTHSLSISRSSGAFSTTSSVSPSDEDFWPRRTSPSSSNSSSSGGNSTGIRSSRTSVRLAFHGRSGNERGERAAVVGDHGALGRATRRGRSDDYGRRSGLFLSLVDPEGSRSRLAENCLEAPESLSGDMLPGVEVARRRRVRIADTYEGGHGGGQEVGHSSRPSRSGVTVAHHHHHYHHHHHHHVHHQASRNPSRPGTPRPGSLVRRMHDFLHDHRAGRSPFEHFSNSNSTDRANAVDGSVNPHPAHRSSRGHGHRSGDGESRVAPLTSLWRRQSSDSSSTLRGAALEARNRLDERLRAAAHANHSRRSWQAVQSSYDMNLLFSDDEEDNLWSDDDGWETSLHEWLAAWAPSAVEERWSRVESSSSGRASSSRNPAFKPRPSEGLSKAAINALPRQVVGSSKTQAGGQRSKMEQEDCPVCLEGFVTGQSLMSLPCNHRFHPECLTPWLANHGQCPYCRADIVKDTDSSSDQKSNSGLMGSSNEELLSWVEAIERGMDRLSYS